MRTGCYTALVTPMTNNTVDYKGLEALVDFQLQSGVTGILAVGTTGESPTLNWEEHNTVIKTVASKCKDKALCIAGAGSNNTAESMNAAIHAADCGVDAILLVDPYYNGPSSLEIRREYIAPVAKAVPDIDIIPYIIPGRTGAQMFPEDLAVLHQQYKNIRCVKEATGDLDNMRRTRECCGKDFLIFSGDDALTFPMMTDPYIAASGIISVASNIVPALITEMTYCLGRGETQRAQQILSDIEPLFRLVTVTTQEETPYGPVACRARNPLALKTLMQLIGMPSGPCRKPLGKMTQKGFEFVLATAREVHQKNPDVLGFAATFFDVDIEERLNNPEYWKHLYYTEEYTETPA
ncbi:4-hydroxy-tetrahydrodipicolinate synthase [Desulfobotulus alkaliphilus]|uniref:4-hydroxy-tetrahydrodipicolinate synthase n=1 Tax=Desulfobotulus alkaliphilus TaxID=622671 RepID=A0A562S2E2_9BACT|nr:4-hydroxy-tetrahydrodipicolinate synthase [Desulfobotulus alkaliphilus]TWI75529.1 4-hydroxy-tetrahydrodipicolinate synthase [Desulfobotulus alkaliphilus]